MRWHIDKTLLALPLLLLPLLLWLWMRLLDRKLLERLCGCGIGYHGG